MLGEGGNKSKLQTPSSLCSAMERAGAVGQMLSWERAFGDMIQGQAVSVVLEHSRIWYAVTEMHHSCPLSAELLLGRDPRISESSSILLVQRPISQGHLFTGI